MELKDAFNNTGYSATKSNPFVLDLYYSSHGGSVYIAVDFITRTMVTRNSYGDAGVVVTPFSQLDRDVLIGLRDKLVELGGTPPELPAEAPTPPAAPRKFNP